VFEPAVVCLWSPAPLAAAFAAHEIPVHVLDRGRLGRFLTLHSLHNIVQQFRPDIVHSFGFAGRAALPAAMLAGIRRHILEIGAIPNWVNIWEKHIDGLVVAKSSLVLCNTEAAVNVLSRQFGLDSAHYRVKYNGLDLDQFDRRAQGEHAPTDPHSIVGEPKGPVVCTVANLRPVKCLDVLIKAFWCVVAEIPTAHLWSVGDGPLREDLESLTKHLGISSRVQFLGSRSEVPELLRYATLGVLSSDSEGLSNAIIEYMAARLPVVATKVGGNPELVIHGRTGLLVAPHDSSGLAEAILYLLRNPDLARRFGEEGRCRVEEHFTAERMARETEAIYEELLSRNGH